jgi:hypothetical protein
MKRVGLLIVLALVAVGSAGAKNNVEATILSAIPKHATPGRDFTSSGDSLS